MALPFMGFFFGVKYAQLKEAGRPMPVTPETVSISPATAEDHFNGAAPPPAASVRVGDQLGDFMVVSSSVDEDGIFIKLEGVAVVNVTCDFGDILGVTCVPDEPSFSQIPRVSDKGALDSAFGFNDPAAKDVLKPYYGKPIKIKIKDFVIRYVPTTKSDTTDLVEIVQ